MKLLSSFSLFVLLALFAITINMIIAAPLDGTWSVPRLTPPPRAIPALECFTIYEADPFASGTNGFTVANATSRLQLFGGEISNGEAVKSTYTWFEDAGQWFGQENLLPVPRAGFNVLFDSFNNGTYQAGTTYMFGGHTAGGALTDNTIYNSQYGAAWSKTLQRKRTKNDAPPLTRFASWIGYIKDIDTTDFSTLQRASTGAMFVWGGLSAGGINSNLYWFSLDQNSTRGLQWGIGSKGGSNAPPARYDHCCQIIAGTEAICFGGAGLNSDFNDVWKIDWSACNHYKATLSTTSGASNSNVDNNCAIFTKIHDGNLTAAQLAGNDFPPSARRGAACAWVNESTGGVLYIFGGYDADAGKAVNDTNLYRFDYGTLKWAKTAQGVGGSSDLTPRYGAKLANCEDPNSNNNTLYLFGGVRADSTYSSETYRIYLGDDSSVFPNHVTSLQFTEIGFKGESRPSGRAEHVAVLSSGELYIMFGRDKLALESAQGDIWKYNLTTQLWQQLEIITDDSNLLHAEIPRTGASAMEFRSGILIFGGQDSLSLATNDLLVLQPLTGELRRVTPTTSAIPDARAYHVMVRIKDTVVIGCGWSSIGGFYSDWWKYNSVDQTWTQLNFKGDAIGARLAMVSLELYNSTHTVVGLGIGSRVFADWFFLTLEDDSSGALNSIRATKIEMQNEIELGERGIIRAYSTAAGSGNHLFVCGGAIAETDPAPESTSCYQVDIAQRKISSFPGPYLPFVYGTGTLVENKIILFGGQETSQTSFVDRFIDVPQIFNINSTCVEGTTGGDALCLKCSKGTRNTGPTVESAYCVVAAEGKYIVNSLGNFVNCPPGTFSRAIGAFSEDACLPCPAGTFNPKPGATNCTPCNESSVCPAGATEPLSADSARGEYLRAALKISGRITEENPKPYEAPPIPWFPILFVGLTALILTSVLTTVLLISHFVWLKRRNYYAPKQVQENLEAIYLEFARSIRGMSEQEFIQATYSDKFPQHEGSLLEMQQLFKELNVNGIGALTFKDFVEAFVLMVSRGHMTPLHGSQREKEGKEFQHWAAPLIGKWDVRNFDQFTDDHMTAAVGEKILSQQISYGGMISLVFYVMVVILVLAIVINFLYNNTTETKASVPRAVIQSSFGSLFQVESDIIASVTVLGPVRVLNSISTLNDACLANPSDTADSTCRTASVTATNVNTGKVSPTTRCSFDNRTGCTVTYTCQGCYIAEGSTGTLLFRVAPQAAASYIDVDISTTTGIRDPVMEFTGKLSMVGGPNQISRVVSRATPRISTQVLTGFPASVLTFGLTPTYYEADDIEGAIDANKPTVKFTGYHSRQASNPVGGNTVPTELFSQYYDTPVSVHLQVDEVPLLVRRKFTQTVVQLIVALLGAIAGLSGGLLAACQWFDMHTGINENSDVVKHEKIEEEDEVAGLNDMYMNIEKLMTAEEFKVLRPLIERGVQPHQALAFLEILRRRRASGGKGSPRQAGRHKSNAAAGAAADNSPTNQQKVVNMPDTTHANNDNTVGEHEADDHEMDSRPSNAV